MPEKRRKANSILQFCRTLHVHVSDLLAPYIKNLSFATLAKFVIVVMMMIIRLVFELTFTHPRQRRTCLFISYNCMFNDRNACKRYSFIFIRINLPRSGWRLLPSFSRGTAIVPVRYRHSLCTRYCCVVFPTMSNTVKFLFFLSALKKKYLQK